MTATLTRPPLEGPAAPPPAARARPPWDWASAGASAAAVLLCAYSLHGVFDGWAWFPPLFLTAAAVVSAMAAARRFRVPTALVPAAGLAALALVLTWLFAASTALLGLLPTGATLNRSGQLINEAQATIMNQVPPVLSDPGIVFIACLGTGLITLLVDTLATTLRMPAASGLGLLALLTVPAVLKPDSIGVFPFILAGAGYLLILATGSWQDRPRSAPADRRPPGRQLGIAAGIGAAALVAALAVPAALPGFNQGTFPQGSRLNIWTGQSGLNPVVALGNDLRQPSASGRIRYATDSGQAVYLRSTTLEDFSGQRWAPDLRSDTRRSGLEDMVPEDGDGPAGGVSTVTTRVRSDTYASPWLLAPYAPVEVSGAAGRFSWDPKNMTIISEANNGTTRLDYEVQSASRTISADSLRVLEPAPEGAVDSIFTDLPEDLPESIREATRTATARANGPYEEAMAIQAYLRGQDFTYSLDAPVEGGYDGNGMDVLDRFLEEKSGYCVHYAAAMAVMARDAGIPSRMALGFAPGRSTGNTVQNLRGQDLREYEVDSRDAHAWPELYFEGMGWVRFEPTPSRGSVPSYALQPRPDIQETPGPDDLLNVDRPLPETVPQPAVPPPAPAPSAPVEPADTGVGQAAAAGLAVVTAAAALLSPWALRVRRRRLRRRGVAGHGRPPSGAGGTAGPNRPPSGPASLAWDEAADTGLDFGHVPAKSESPRAYAARLADDARLADGPSLALERLREAYEQEVYAAPGAVRGAPGPGRGLEPGPGTGGAADDRAGRLWADVTAVQDGLAASASWTARLRARYFPASLASRFRR
ncbi:DUF3488 and transglutaminase-like domain-containing protein [Arthrobacter sp. ATA002]|uniref:transglutaminase family protein n=1 Tax=Arthrobacter sp. ATA002 TaxID=2991715 RepID=UPI0022A77EF0|nr:DUF3488 and transglutaminase-like domain-containing protein [Arthrobacter sp. ATA002]WAP51192.1 DUF3488 and transglutaminase-like domain-containing protein [Arthrobacter sp. ATA002]